MSDAGKNIILEEMNQEINLSTIKLAKEKVFEVFNELQKN